MKYLLLSIVEVNPNIKFSYRVEEQIDWTMVELLKKGKDLPLILENTVKRLEYKFQKSKLQNET